MRFSIGATEGKLEGETVEAERDVFCNSPADSQQRGCVDTTEIENSFVPLILIAGKDSPKLFTDFGLYRFGRLERLTGSWGIEVSLHSSHSPFFQLSNPQNPQLAWVQELVFMPQTGTPNLVRAHSRMNGFRTKSPPVPPDIQARFTARSWPNTIHACVASSQIARIAQALKFSLLESLKRSLGS